MKISELKLGECYVETINSDEPFVSVVVYIGNTAGWRVLGPSGIQYIFANVKHGTVHSYSDSYFEDGEISCLAHSISFRPATIEEIDQAMTREST